MLREVVIIGTGSAMLTAAIYAARAFKSFGYRGTTCGQLTITTEVENFPGFADVIQGPWLMEQMRSQAINVGAEIIGELVVKVDFSSYPKNHM